jgi:enterobactin synthetase component D
MQLFMQLEGFMRAAPKNCTGMLLCNATALVAQLASNMIRPTAPVLQIDRNCRQASCYFDRSLLRDETASRLGITMPVSLNSAVQKRKAEFIAGRVCAHTALAQLGADFCHPDGDATDDHRTIGIGAHRQPLWPPGFVGSITHTENYASALVARSNEVRAIGIDSEQWISPETLESVSQQILADIERPADHLAMFHSPIRYLTLVFSAKESLFKCLFPLTNTYFDFKAAAITPLASGAATGGKFRFELLEDLNTEFQAGYSGFGSYSICSDSVHTAIILKAMV